MQVTIGACPSPARSARGSIVHPWAGGPRHVEDVVETPCGTKAAGYPHPIYREDYALQAPSQGRSSKWIHPDRPHGLHERARWARAHWQAWRRGERVEWEETYDKNRVGIPGEELWAGRYEAEEKDEYEEEEGVDRRRCGFEERRSSSLSSSLRRSSSVVIGDFGGSSSRSSSADGWNNDDLLPSETNEEGTTVTQSSSPMMPPLTRQRGNGRGWQDGLQAAGSGFSKLSGIWFRAPAAGPTREEKEEAAKALENTVAAWLEDLDMAQAPLRTMTVAEAVNNPGFWLNGLAVAPLPVTSSLDDSGVHVG